jgi:hypothetical protein
MSPLDHRHAANHLVVQGAIPLALTLVGTIVRCYTTPAPGTVRLLQNFAGGLLVGTVCERLFPDFVSRSVETPLTMLGGCTGYVLAVTMSIWFVQQECVTKVPETIKRFKTMVAAAIGGLITGTVLFERLLIAVSVPYLVAVGAGIKQLVKSLTFDLSTDPQTEFAHGLEMMTVYAGFFAMTLAVVPVLEHSFRPLYTLFVSFVAMLTLSIGLSDIISIAKLAVDPDSAKKVKGSPSDDNLVVNPLAESTMFYVGIAFVLASRWITNSILRQKLGSKFL